MITSTKTIRSSAIFLIVYTIGCIMIPSSVNGFTTSSTGRGGGRHKSLIGKKSYPSLVGRNEESTILHMARPKKKRRKRKQSSQPDESSSTTSSSTPKPIIPDDDIQAMKELAQSGTNRPTLDEIKAIANFQAPKGSGTNNASQTPGIPQPGDDGENLVDLPSIRNVLKNKEMKKIEEEEAQKQRRPKISRGDTKAFVELLELEPFADGDDSYFEDEEYGTVSALLGEGAKPFLGIPPGPLQVGHFIGSLGIMLCAFIEYPGFPLTNLPLSLIHI